MGTKKQYLKLRFDRILSRGFWSQIGLLASLMLLAFFLANIILLLSPTDWARYCNDHRLNRWIAPLYLLIDGNAFTSVYENHANHWTIFLSCIIYVIGIFLFTGMMVSVMTNIIERRVEKHRNGLVHYLEKGHYIIMGYDDTIPSFINHIFHKDPDAYILVLTSRPPELVREKLLNSFTQKQLDRVIINYGHRTSPEEYSKIHLESSKEVFIVGYMGQLAHDPINVECVDAICNYLSKLSSTVRPQRITCVFRDLDTYTAFQSTEIFSRVGELGIEFIPYNYSAGWARQVLSKRYYFDWKDEGVRYPYPSVFRGGITPDDKHYVHLVFVGTTNVAVAFASEAAQILHFPNYAKHPGLKTLISFIDINADKEKNEFITRNRHFFEVQPYIYRDLSSGQSRVNEMICKEYIRREFWAGDGESYNFLDVEFQFIKGDIFSRQVQELLNEWAADTEGQYLSVFLALADQRTNFVMAMNMPDNVYDNGVPVFISQRRSDNFVTNLREADRAKGKKEYYKLVDGKVEPKDREQRYANIYPFGMDETVFYSDEVVLKRAKLINYLYGTMNFDTNKFTDILVLDTIPDNDIFAKADQLWHPLSVAIKWSNLYNAYSLETKLASLRAMRGLSPDDYSQDLRPLSQDEADTLASVEHNRWNVEKLLMGYRKPIPDEDAYSATKVSEEDKNKLKKNKNNHWIHHDIRPFNQLSGIVELDKEFSRFIPWILRMTPTNN